MGNVPRRLSYVCYYSFGGGQLPFFEERKSWSVKGFRAKHNDLLEHTNINEVDFFIMSIAKSGGHDYFKLKELDTKELLDLAEFEHIWNAMQYVQSGGE